MVRLHVLFVTLRVSPCCPDSRLFQTRSLQQQQRQHQQLGPASCTATTAMQAFSDDLIQEQQHAETLKNNSVSVDLDKLCRMTRSPCRHALFALFSFAFCLCSRFSCLSLSLPLTHCSCLFVSLLRFPFFLSSLISFVVL